jgi:hypothetical protein
MNALMFERSNKEGSMIRPIFFITVSFGLLVASQQGASAALCFHYTKTDGGTSIAQVDIPAPNKCVTFALYEQVVNAPFTLAGVGTGSLCTSTNSPMVIYHYTYEGCLPLGSDNYFETGTCRLQLNRDLGLPTQFSFCRGALITGKPGQPGKAGNFSNTDDLVITKCDSDTNINYQVPSGQVADCSEFKLRLQSLEQPSQSPGQLRQNP